MPKSHRLLMNIFLTGLCLACSPATSNLPFGLAAETAGYVPARIAVMSCAVWPNGARFKSLPLSNVNENTLKSLCEQFDQFVIEGFKDQPYMRGFSPSAVKKLLDESQSIDLLGKLSDSWAFDKNFRCNDCETTPGFYVSAIYPRTNWRSLLNEFSRSVRNADAALLPFLTFAYEKIYTDRGVRVFERGAAVSLLLVDTNQGALLWSGGREASNSFQTLNQNSVPDKEAWPSWDSVYERLFTEDIWRDFPGRQIFK